MAEAAARSSTKINPAAAWSVLTDAPLKGMGLAREAGVVFAWDEADQLYRVDARGDFQSVARSPGKVVAASMSDDGSLVAILGEKSHLWLLDGDFEVLHDRSAVGDAISVAVDPHGRYVAVASKLNVVQFYTRYGKQAGRFETRQPLSQMHFVAGSPMLVGIGTYGTIMGMELAVRGGSSRTLAGEVTWYEALMSGVGRLASTGDASMILVSCFSHGVQRFNGQGKSEGAYHLGGSAAQAVPDFAGRTIGVSTLEGELAILSGGGNVRWRTTLPRPASFLEIDPLGRYLIHGQETGEVTRLELYGGRGDGDTGSNPNVAAVPSAAPTQRGSAASVVAPSWTAEVVQAEDLADYAVLAIAPKPGRIGLVSTKNKLELFDPRGKRIGQSPEIDGVGRIIRTCPGWMAAATDRRIVVCDLVRNTAQRVDIALNEVTHLAIRPDSYGLAFVQERDRIGRATLAGRWIWRLELDSPVEELAIDEGGDTAVTTEDGRLRVYDAGGRPIGDFRGTASDPAFLVACPEGHDALRWITLSRRSQKLRGHDRSGKVVWEATLPWEAWQFQLVGDRCVALAPDGRGVAYDLAGNLVDQGQADGPADGFCVGPGGKALRVTRRGVHLICSGLDGRVAWRMVAADPLGPIAVSDQGVAVLLGKALAWVPHPFRRDGEA